MTADEIERQVIERMGKAYLDYAAVLKELNDLKTGQMVMLPHSIEHAKWMVMVGEHYIAERHRETFDALVRSY